MRGLAPISAGTLDSGPTGASLHAMTGLLRPALLLLAITPASAIGEELQPCWSLEATPGLFDWHQAPSTACRDGETVTGVPSVPGTLPAPPPGASLTEASTQGASAAPRPSLIFSAEAQVGVAVRF